jgi:amino acid transporter
MVGMMIGAGIFKVTGLASDLTGPSVILGYAALAPLIFASAIPYVVFLSTPLGRQPGGDYTHIRATFRSPLVAFLSAWLKVISYLGALAFLAQTFADYAIALLVQTGVADPGDLSVTGLALAGLLCFFVIHALGVRWFGRLQVAMFAVLGVSILVLIVPGLFAIRTENYQPLFTDGLSGFAASMLPLFFAYAGFEALAHSGGEVKESTKRLPRIVLRGVAITTVIYMLMSIVAFGVLPTAQLAAADAPMAAAASVYLPGLAAALVTLGAILAAATSMNTTMMIPPRLGIMLAQDGHFPGWIGHVNPRTGTPILGLALTAILPALLLLSGQLLLALNISVFALMIVYALHSAALLRLHRVNPELAAQVTVPIPPRVQRAAALFSVLALGALIVLNIAGDAARIWGTDLASRFDSPQGLTSLELFFPWLAIGLLIYLGRRPRAAV